MGDVIEDVNYYALLEVEPTATLEQIRKAYRQRSLKVHPDRNPDNPAAAALFHDLKTASAILLDPIQRASFDALLNARNARKLRFAALDSKRKAMAEELERGEREFKRRKETEGQQKSEVDRLKEEGRKMREARMNGGANADKARDEEVERIKEAERARRKAQQSGASSNVVELGPLDTTLKLKFHKSASLSDSPSLIAHLRSLLGQDPNVDLILGGGEKIPKGRASVKFGTLAAAVRLMDAKAKAGETGAWKGIEVSWASGKRPEVLGGEPSPPPPSHPSAFPASMLVDSDEDRILAQLRAKERQKMMEEMERQEAEDEN